MAHTTMTHPQPYYAHNSWSLGRSPPRPHPRSIDFAPHPLQHMSQMYPRHSSLSAQPHHPPLYHPLPHHQPPPPPHRTHPHSHARPHPPPMYPHGFVQPRQRQPPPRLLMPPPQLPQPPSPVPRPFGPPRSMSVSKPVSPYSAPYPSPPPCHAPLPTYPLEQRRSIEHLREICDKELLSYYPLQPAHHTPATPPPPPPPPLYSYPPSMYFNTGSNGSNISYMPSYSPPRSQDLRSRSPLPPLPPTPPTKPQYQQMSHEGLPRPNPGFGPQHPLRPIPPHLQRPPFEQPMIPLPNSNPLEDLADTEKEFVADLKILLQRVSAGWTQEDFPPKVVDLMLRNIEEIYAVNRKLSKKLGEIMSYPDPNKELGPTLLWFVDTMEAPYSNYCRNHEPLLDNWPEIINNSRLQNILTEIAAEQVQHVTLDSFLMKPIDRLHYYRRLYMRLLESSERGKPDYDGLEAAFMRIDTILRFVTVEVPGTSRHPASPALSGISSMSTLRNALPSPPISDQHPNQYPQQGSPNFPPHGRSPMSPALPPSPLSPGMPSPRPPMPANGEPSRAVEVMLDLEQSLDTSRTLDLFSMQPKACALSLAQVERRVVVRSNFCFSVATDTGIEERYEDGHILLLSDLLLMCRTKTQEEIDSNPEGNRSVFWLVFPPLAVRHVTAYDGTMEDQIPAVELSIVNRVRTRIWVHDEQRKQEWINEVNNAQQADANKAMAQQPQLNRSMTQQRPQMRPPNSPMSPTFHQGNGEPFNGPMSPQYGPGPMSPQYGPGPVSPRPPMLAMGARPPMQGGNGMPPSPGYRPMSPGGGMGRPPPMMYPPRPGPPMHGQARPFNRAMSMRRSNTMGSLKGGPRGRIVAKGDAAAAKEVLFKSRPCDVFQWREEAWEPLVEEDDCYVELRLTTSNRLAMAVMTFESGQLVLNAWIVDSTTFRRASETDVSVSMDMGASVQWFLVAMNTAREAEEFCMSFQRTKDRAMYDPHVQKSSSPVLSRGDSLASTVTSTTAGLTPKRPVKQTLSTMYPPAECKLFLQGGDHGQWINLGSARVEVKRETPSGHVRLFLTLASGNRRVLDSVIVQEDCLELVGPKKLAITLMNPQEKMSIIYMLQFKEETITTKIFEALSLNENE